MALSSALRRFISGKTEAPQVTAAKACIAAGGVYDVVGTRGCVFPQVPSSGARKTMAIIQRRNGNGVYPVYPPPGGNISDRFTVTPVNPLPPPTGTTPARMNFGEDIAGGLVNIGLDWLRNKVIPGGTGSTALDNPQPTPIPDAKCPEGQFGIPPACFDLQPGGGTQGGGMLVTYGEAVIGRYGAAIQPAVHGQQVRRCPRGAVLGNDGLCYNKSDLKRSERWWVPGRKPLLTGGDLNAISKANRAANKLRSKQKQLQKMGMLPKPTSRGRTRGRGGWPIAGSPVPGVQLISND